MHIIHTLYRLHNRTGSFRHRFRLPRRFVLTALIAISVLLLGGCTSSRNSPDQSAASSASSARSVFSVLGHDAEAFAASWEASNVTQVTWIRNYETSETITLSAGAPEIQELFRALSGLQIGESTDEMASDSGDVITVTMKDGSSFTFTFNGGNLVSGKTIFQTSGKKALYTLSNTLFSGTPD